MSALRELAVVFGADTAGAVKNIKGLDAVIGGAKASLGTLAASIVGAFSLHAASDFIKEQIEIGSKLNDTADKLGVSTEELQKFQFAAGLSGVSAEGAGRALGFLNKNLGEAIGGGAEQAKTFADLGINLAEVKNGSKSATDLLPDVAKKMASLGSDAERTALSMKVFGKQGATLLPFLKQSPEEVAKLSAEFTELGGGMSSDFIGMADKAGDEIDKLKFAFQGLKSRLAVDVLPTVTEWAQKLQKAVVYVRHLTKETYIVRDALVLLGIAGGAAAAKTAIGWAKVFGLFPKGNAGIVKTLASMGYLGLIIAAIAALALVFEDLWVGVEGGDSAIRGWLIAANGVEETDKLFAQFRKTADSIKASFEGMKPAIGSVVSELGKLVMSPEFTAAVEFVVRLLGAAVAESLGFARALGSLVKGDFKGAADALGEGDAAAFGKKGFLGADAWGPSPTVAPGAAPGAGAFVGPSYLNPASPDFQGGPTTVTQTFTMGDITVEGGATNAETGQAVAAVVRNTFQEQNQNAVAALAVGAVGGRGSKL